MSNKNKSLLIKSRMNQVQKAAQEVSKKWIEQYNGKEMEILVEEKTPQGWLGYTPYYFKIHLAEKEGRKNQIMKLRISLDNIS